MSALNSLSVISPDEVNVQDCQDRQDLFLEADSQYFTTTSRVTAVATPIVGRAFNNSGGLASDGIKCSQVLLRRSRVTIYKFLLVMLVVPVIFSPPILMCVSIIMLSFGSYLAFTTLFTYGVLFIPIACLGLCVFEFFVKSIDLLEATSRYESLKTVAFKDIQENTNIDFMCAISLDTPSQPVWIEGEAALYDYKNIVQWCGSRRVLISPLTRNPVQLTKLVRVIV